MPARVDSRIEGDAAPSNSTRPSRRRGRRQARQNRREQARTAKAQAAAEKADKKGTARTTASPLPAQTEGATRQTDTKDATTTTAEPAERFKRFRRRKETSAQEPPPPSSPEPPDGRAVRRDRRRRINEASAAVASQRQDGKAAVAEAKQRSRSNEYLAARIPPGDWNRRELRRHVKEAKRVAAEEVSSVKAEQAALLAEARDQRSALKRSLRRLVRTGRAHLAHARVRSIRLGLAGSWAGLAVFAWLAWETGDIESSDHWIPLAGGTAGMVALSSTPWKRLGGRPIASILIFLWLGLLMGGVMATAPLHESTLAIFIASVWILLYAGVLLPLVGFAAAAAAAIAVFGLSVEAGPVGVEAFDFALYVAGLAMTTVIVGITVHELRSQAIHTAQRLSDLDTQSAALVRRESELMQLYEVSRTIGAGDDMRQVLPELVARTAGYVEAKVGLVILHKPEDGELVALSPLWVAGQALEAEGYRFKVDGDSTAASVFSSGATYVRNQVTELDISHDQLLADLGVIRVAAVPLRVEGSTIGVLLVADKATDFTDADAAALELLSTPAGLVLNHLARYEQAQETGRRMSEVAQLKSDFVSVVSHELRTPLTSVIGALSTLSRPELAPEDPVASSLLESASSQANRLKTLIEDLLTVSKIDNAALPIRLESTDVGELLARLIGRIPAWTDHIELDLSPLLPPVAIDPDHFERVITNLVDNARKYASDSPIELTARPVDDEVWVSVIDHGEGIPYEYEGTIFERFTQIERPDTRFKGGTGLGLNIVKDLTEAMHGRVWLEATPGSGATFTVAFPRADDNLAASIEVGPGMLLVDPSRDRVEAPINMDDLPGSGGSPVAE
jgi:signal transduction histidine kinase